MSRPSKLLFVGVTVALLTVGVGWLGTARTERELATLQQSCEEALAVAGYPPADVPPGFRLLGLPPDATSLPPAEVRRSWCNTLPSAAAQRSMTLEEQVRADPRFEQLPPEKQAKAVALAQMKDAAPQATTPGPAAAVAVRGNIFRAQRRLEAWRTDPFVIAATVVVLCALPWLWYFLLARIRELSAAIRGTGAGGG
ncbi:MAG: hypothetical protein ACHQ9S_07270 [Candidatus Binatia bacterium]